MSGEKVQERPKQCYFCQNDRGEILEEHHIVPRRYGGGDSPANLLTVCPNCHRKLEEVYDDQFFAAVSTIKITDDQTHPREKTAGALKQEIRRLEKQCAGGVPVNEPLEKVCEMGFNPTAVEAALRWLKVTGEVDEPRPNHVRTS